jgi:NAD(P)-dependent dehydrogenase (short-subunit alcohol dehydrogenase family)
MDLGLNDKAVLVTGGSKGIGLACALAFHAEGARIAIASRHPEHLASAVQTLRDAGAAPLAVQADLADAAQAARMAAEVDDTLGAIDVLVTCAGAARRTPPAELTAAHWAAAMQAKYFPTIHAMDAVLPLMTRRGAGTIVNVVGMGGKLATPTHLPGGAANAALMLASVGLANAHAAQGVRINVVNPGLTATSRLHEGLAAEARLSGRPAEQLLAERTRAMPLGRIAEPGEIAQLVVFVASPRASYLSGAVIALDGAATPTVV